MSRSVSSLNGSTRERRNRRLAAIQSRGRFSERGINTSSGSIGGAPTSKNNISSSPPLSPTGGMIHMYHTKTRCPPSPPRSSRPPIVSPHYTNSSSWENEDRASGQLFVPNTLQQPHLTQQSHLTLAPRYRSLGVAPRGSSDRSVASEVVTGNKSKGSLGSGNLYGFIQRTSPRTVASLSGNRSVVSESNAVRLSRQSKSNYHQRDDNSDMPGDELDTDAQSLNSSVRSEDRRREISRLAALRLTAASSSSLPGDLTTAYNMSSNSSVIMDDDVSSLGGVEDQSGAVQRITLAIRHQSARPSSLTREERTLWDAIQTAIRKAKSNNKNGRNENSKNESNSDNDDWRQKFTELQDRTAAQERDHLSSLRAIQRVLADVQKERDAAVKCVKERQQEEQVAACKQANDSETLLQELQNLQQQLSSKDSRIGELQEELAVARATTESLEHQTEKRLGQRLERAEMETKRLASELDASRREVSVLSCRLGNSSKSVNSSDPADLRRQLSEKSAALENAKMIIASLESASGALAADMRAKLSRKKDEVALLKVAASDRQKTLDNVARQLRELQRSRASTRHCHRVDEERSRRLGLSSRLEKNMADIRAASVVLESTNDPATADQISNLLGDSIAALRDGIDVIEEETEDSSTVDVESTVSYNDSASVGSSRGSPAPVDVRRLRKELDDRTRALYQAEEALRREREETASWRAEREQRKQQDEQLHSSLRQEVTSLREQCQTNMEVLTRKERELAVLRDSLKVDDGVGYISDDGSDDGTESDGTDAAVSNSVAQFCVGPHYGPSQAEALATLLSHSSSAGGMDVPNSSGELQDVRRELLQARTEIEKCHKQLKTEKESLANAKMIISSLEKANKSMMEDLKSRLQDSNTAIASLLEKSLQSEKTTAKLRDELDAIRNEKEEERDQYEAELKRIRSEASPTHPRSPPTSPPRDYRHHTSETRSIHHDYRPSSVHSATSIEEKKEDILPPPPTETID